MERIAYSAAGQRALIAYGRGAGDRGVMTRYAYDPATARLLRMRSEPYALISGPLPGYRPTAPGSPLQEYGYSYDVAGNLLTLRDRTPGSGVQGTLLGPNALDRQFRYDPLGRLRSATGRECDQASPSAAPWSAHPRCTDLTKARSYTQRYEYDLAGNLTHLSHTQYGTGGAVGGFTRHYEMAPGTDRLQRMTVDSLPFTYRHDGCGNLLGENTDRHFEWDHANRLRAFRNQTGQAQPTTHAQYLYDAASQRTIKFVRLRGGIYETTIYIDGIFEHRRWHVSGKLRENNLVHIMDDQRRIALRRIGERHPDDTGPEIQFHLGDHLGSANLVLDETGAWTNREEYTPYGETSFGSFALKRYRFTGRERDGETGFSYHGARYYAPWLAQWASCDPLGPVDSTNLYVYARNNPITYMDPGGGQTAPTQQDYIKWYNSLTPEQKAKHLYDSRRLEEALSSQDAQVRNMALRQQMVPAEGPAQLPEFAPPAPPPSDLERSWSEFKMAVGGVMITMNLAFTVTDYLTWPAQLVCLIPAARQRATGLAFEELGSASLLDKELKLGAAWAERRALFLHPIGKTEVGFRRTTTAVFFGRGPDGEIRSYIAGGSFDPTKSYVTRYGLTGEEIPVRLADIRMELRQPGTLHAEEKLLLYFEQEGIQPVAGAASWKICPTCSLLGGSQGGRVLENPRLILFPGGQ